MKGMKGADFMKGMKGADFMKGGSPLMGPAADLGPGA